MHRRVETIRSLLIGWLCVGPFFGVAAASAATLPIEATLTMRLGTTQISAAASGLALVNGSGAGGPLTQLQLPAGLFDVAGIAADVTDPAAFPIMGLVLSAANGAGSFAIGSDGHLGGAMSLPGRERFCLFAPCGAAIANLTVPLTPIGAGGSAFQDGVIGITVVGAPWTTGTAMHLGLGTETWTGFAQGPASAPDSTGRAGGSLQLVTPFAVTSSIAGDGPPSGFAFLTLHFVPEPASALLVASGLAAVATLARRRRPSA